MSHRFCRGRSGPRGPAGPGPSGMQISPRTSYTHSPLHTLSVTHSHTHTWPEAWTLKYWRSNTLTHLTHHTHAGGRVRSLNTHHATSFHNKSPGSTKCSTEKPYRCFYMHHMDKNTNVFFRGWAPSSRYLNSTPSSTFGINWNGDCDPGPFIHRLTS